MPNEQEINTIGSQCSQAIDTIDLRHITLLMMARLFLDLKYFIDLVNVKHSIPSSRQPLLFVGTCIFLNRKQ